MKLYKTQTLAALLLLAIFISACNGLTPPRSSLEAYWPSEEWRASTPKEQEMVSENNGS